MEEPNPPPAALLFEAVIVPHRSLSRRGIAILAGTIAGLCGLTVLRFWLLHAWPVVGFSVVEVGLALWLLCHHARATRASELVLLSENALHIIRTDAKGRRQERRLESAWLNVVMEEMPGRVPRIILATRHAREEIGTVLGEPERRSLAAALADALYRARHRIFDNSQLRE